MMAYQQKYIYNSNAITCLPPSILYHDEHTQKQSKKHVYLNGWKLCKNDFILISKTCVLIEFTLDYSTFDMDCLQILRGHKLLQVFSMRKVNIHCNKSIAEILCSWPALIKLDISENTVEYSFFQCFVLACIQIQYFICDKCIGFNDACCNKLSEIITRYHTLQKVSFENCSSLQNEGILSFMLNGVNNITYLNIANTQCSSLCIAALRKKTLTLKYLNISGIYLDLYSFEWISEGCHLLTYLNISHNPQLEDDVFLQITNKCTKLLHLNISYNILLTDIGLSKAFIKLNKFINILDISHIVNCSNNAIHALEDKVCITNLKFNGLSQISPKSLKSLLSKLNHLTHFEMKANLHTVITHRKSLIPHFNNSVLLSQHFSSIICLNISGCSLISDSGLVPFIQYACNLQNIDVSYCHGVTDLSVISIALYNINIRNVNISGCNQITDKSIVQLCTNCMKLEQLEMVSCRITDISLQTCFTLKNIRVINIRQCDNITDIPFVNLSTCKDILRYLYKLDISGLDLVTNKSVVALSKVCHSLTDFRAGIICIYLGSHFYNLMHILYVYNCIYS